MSFCRFLQRGIIILVSAFVRFIVRNIFCAGWKVSWADDSMLLAHNPGSPVRKKKAINGRHLTSAV